MVFTLVMKLNYICIRKHCRRYKSPINEYNYKHSQSYVIFNDPAFSGTWQSTNTDTKANTHSSIHSLGAKMQRTLIPLVLGSDRCSKSQEIGQGADLAGPGGVMQGRPTQGVLFIQHVGNP